MSAIRTWGELLASDLPLRGDEVDYSSVGKEFGIIHKPTDNLLSLDWGLCILSVLHPVLDTVVNHEELMLVVREAVLDLVHGDKPYLPASVGRAHYRTAQPLGLVGNHADVNVHSVLVSTEKLDLIEFSKYSAPLKQWERELLSGA